MIQPKVIRRINKEFKELQDNPIENVIALPNPRDILEWHFVIYDLKNSPFENGIYHGKLQLSNDYPFKPPTIFFITPNGRFHTM